VGGFRNWGEHTRKTSLPNLSITGGTKKNRMFFLVSPFKERRGEQKQVVGAEGRKRGERFSKKEVSRIHA